MDDQNVFSWSWASFSWSWGVIQLELGRHSFGCVVAESSDVVSMVVFSSMVVVAATTRCLWLYDAAKAVWCQAKATSVGRSHSQSICVVLATHFRTTTVLTEQNLIRDATAFMMVDPFVTSAQLLFVACV